MSNPDRAASFHSPPIDTAYVAERAKDFAISPIEVDLVVSLPAQAVPDNAVDLLQGSGLAWLFTHSFLFGNKQSVHVGK